MKNIIYPMLGDKVAYIRHTGTDVLEGEGVVLGMGLDGNKRPIVLMEGDVSGNVKRFNCDLAALNPSDEYKEAFKTGVARIQALAQEGNDKSAAVVAEYNNMVDEAYNEFLGMPVVLG